MDFIEETEAKMLSCSWEELQHDKVLRTNLFRGLSRVLLKLGRVPLPQIGSFTMNDEGFLSLTNRPLTLEIHQLENEGIPTHINRDLTYSTVESYLLDLLAYHDNRLLHQPNSVRNEDDCRQQMAALTIMRSLFPHFFSRDLRHGPFLLTLTDLHQSNIFVDDNWNIKYLIDLEWACSLPIEMQHPPYWLTNRCVDGLVEEHLAAFDELREEFMDAFEGEERRIPPTQENGPLRTSIMRRGWRVGNFWYYHAVDSSRLLYNIFCRHIQPKFASSHGVDPAFDRILSPYWSAEADKVVAAKIKDKEKYDVQLCEAFEAARKEPQKEDE